MENRRILLWKKAPYERKTKEIFEPSITEYRINDTKSAVIVCPGGGYHFKAGHEGEPIARMLNKGGVNAFLLDYNVSPCHKFAPLSDAQRAIRTVRSLGYERVAVLGFSAGGHLACSAATLYDFEAYAKTDAIDELSARPDAFVPCYPVVSMSESYGHMGSRQMLLADEWEDPYLMKLFSAEKNITENTPPCFIWHTANDSVVPVKNSLELANRLLENNVYFEMHIYPDGRHGLGLATDRNDISKWTDSCVIFLKNVGF